MKRIILIWICILLPVVAWAQSSTSETIEHLEPVVSNFKMDLGNRQGDMEANAVLEVADYRTYLGYLMAASFEYGVAQNLGVQVQLPFQIFSNFPGKGAAVPAAELQGVEVSLQYTVWQNRTYGLSLAGGATMELAYSELTNLSDFTINDGLGGKVFGVGAWAADQNWHHALQVGVDLTSGISSVLRQSEVDYALLYQFGTGTFIGSEVNVALEDGLNLHLHPQLGLAFANDWMLGVAVGVPIIFTSKRESLFLRLSKAF